MRYSYSGRVAQVVERDTSNIKVVSSILTAVKVFFTFPVETHSLKSTFSKHYYQVYNTTISYIIVEHTVVLFSAGLI